MGKDLTQELRSLVIFHRESGKSLGGIAKLLDLTKSTVQKICDRFFKHGRIENSPSTKGSRKLSNSDKEFLLGELRTNPGSTAVELNEMLSKSRGTNVSTVTVRRFIRLQRAAFVTKKRKSATSKQQRMRTQKPEEDKGDSWQHDLFVDKLIMPSVDHCANKPTEMTTITNSLEVFDTYKRPEEEKESDEESFHLHLDDDDLESSKYGDGRSKTAVDQRPDIVDSAANGIATDESEDEILNKFEKESDLGSQPKEADANSSADKAAENGTNGEESSSSSAFISPLLDVKCEPENPSQVTSDEVRENEDDKKDDLSEGDVGKADVVSNSETDDKDDKCLELSASEKTIQNVDDVDVKIVQSCSEQTETIAAMISDENGTKIDEDADVGVIQSRATEQDVAESEPTEPKSEGEKVQTTPMEIDDKETDECKDENLESAEKDSNLEGDENVLNSANVDDGESRTEQMDTDEEKASNDVPKKVDEDKSAETEKTDSERIEPAKEEVNNAPDNRSDNSNHFDDLMDISVIRDAAEDNAENAYNEAHPEGSDSEDRNSDKGPDDDVDDSDKMDNVEEDEVDDSDKADQVEVEETTLNQDCDVIDKDDFEGSNDKDEKSDTTANEKVGAEDDEFTEITLDECTGDLLGGNSQNKVAVEDKTADATDNHKDDERRMSLKRSAPDEVDDVAVKKSKVDDNSTAVVPVVLDKPAVQEKPAKAIAVEALRTLAEFMRTKKTHKLSKFELEEFCLQKICEAIAHKSELGEVQHQLKVQEQLVETMRKEIQQLTKQARDLEIVNKKLMNDFKNYQQNITQKPLAPLRITRSVGLQVKFTQLHVCDSNKRKSMPTLATTPVQQRVNLGNATNNKGQRGSPAMPTVRNQQVQKTSTILSQALQNRRAGPSDSPTNRNTPQAGGTRPAVGTPLPSNKTAGTTTTNTATTLVAAATTPTAATSTSSSVIDLTDEDDRKAMKNANNALPTQRVIAQKSTPGIVMRTSPVTPVRTLNTNQIRLTSSSGKPSTITSVVTTNAGPQLMYVVQSSPQNSGLGGNGAKAVVVNFQPTNGVLTSTLNGSAVSVIPKASNTIQLKTVSPATKQLQNNKMKSSKHPAPLPFPPLVRVDKTLKPIPPKPHLTIRKTETGIILQWRMPYELDLYEEIASYQLYAYQETNALPSTDMWRRVGDVKALALPMACTLTQFADKNRYYFAVRPVDIHKRIGAFSDPEEISL